MDAGAAGTGGVAGRTPTRPGRRGVLGLHPGEAEVLVVALLASGAALAGGLAGAAPTGGRVTDVVLAALAAAVVTAFGARAGSWALVAAAALALGFGGPVALRVVAGIALVLALVAAGAQRRAWRRATAAAARRRAETPTPGPAGAPGVGGGTEPAAPEVGLGEGDEVASAVLRAGSALGTVAVLLRLPDGSPPRASAAVAAVGMAVVVWSGWRRSPAPARRLARWTGGLVALAAVVVVAGGGVAGLSARSSIRDGLASTEAGLAAARSGEQAEAVDRFDDGALALARARDRTRAWWARPARYVPVVGRQLLVLDAIADVGGRAAALAADGARQVDADGLRLVDGRLDPGAVAIAGPVFRAVAEGTAALAAELVGTEAGSLWWLPPLARGHERLVAAVDRAEESARTAALAAEVGPGLLGADAPVRYLVVLTSPSEARAAGYPAGRGVLTADAGQLSFRLAGEDGEDGPTDGGPGSGGADGWDELTVSPDWPEAARALADRHRATGGKDVDGVLRLGPTGLARLLRLTGPVEVEGVPHALDDRNVVSFLQVEQYRGRAFREDGVDLTGRVAEHVFDVLGTGAGPAPARLARVLEPAVRGQDVSLWLRDPRAQELVERLGATGAAIPLAGDGFGVITHNLGGNKVDAFLQRTVHYEAVVDGESGRVEARAEIGLKNSAPASDGPDGLVGNDLGAPPGTNRMALSVYSPLDVVAAWVDDEEVEVERAEALGRTVWSLVVEVPPGGTANVSLDLVGTVGRPGGRYRFDYLPQVMTLPDRVDVDVLAVEGALRAVPVGLDPPGGVADADGVLRVRVDRSEGPWAVAAQGDGA